MFESSFFRQSFKLFNLTFMFLFVNKLNTYNLLLKFNNWLHIIIKKTLIFIKAIFNIFKYNIYTNIYVVRCRFSSQYKKQGNVIVYFVKLR